MTVARNGAIDRLRRSSTYRAKVGELAVMAARETGTGNPGWTLTTAASRTNGSG